MDFHWSLSNSKSPQVSRTLLSILTDLNNAVVWMVSTRSPTSKSSNPFNNPLVTVPKAPITIGIIITFMFHSFFNSLARSRDLFFSYSFSFILWSAGTAKSTILQILSFFFFFFFFFWWLFSSLVFWPRLSDPFVCQSRIGIFQDIYWVVLIPFVRMAKFQFLAHLPMDHLAHPIVSSLIFLLC